MTRPKFLTLLAIVCGVIVGAGAYFLYALRFHTYLGDEPATCVNCHIMAPYYSAWMHSSHGRDATCNDCHVPQDNFVRKYAFKGVDGLKHTAKFITHSERLAIRAEEPGSEVIMDNCIRCHEQLTNEFVKDGRMDFMMTQKGQGKACWDCHRDIPHTRRSSIASAPAALVPYPPSPVPAWLRKSTEKQTTR